MLQESGSRTRIAVVFTPRTRTIAVRDERRRAGSTDVAAQEPAGSHRSLGGLPTTLRTAAATLRSRMSQGLALLLLAGAICGLSLTAHASLVPEEEILVDAACAYGCGLTGGSHVDYAGVGGAQAGRAVAMVKLGGDPGAPRHAVVGAPEYGSNRRGRVFVHEIIGGILSSTPVQELVPSADMVASAAAAAFGAAITTAEIRSDACGTGVGRELVIGAPGDGSTAYGGRIRWYTAGSSPWDIGGEFAPAVSTVEFGFSLAAPPATSASSPSAQEHTWLAVGDPGTDQVFILEVSSCRPQPLTVYQAVPAPAVARGGRFGHAITVGDFDGDGRHDLAIGAPEETTHATHGRVYVYRNRSGDSGWAPGDLLFTSGQRAEVNPERPDAPFPGYAPSRLGHSLAVGRFWAAYNDRDVLVAGLPHFSPSPTVTRTGAVFQAAFGATSSASGVDFELIAHDRFINPSGQSAQQFGAALVVGSFARCDAPLVAVGIPGFNGHTGKVAVYHTSAAGLEIDESYGEYAALHRSGYDPSAAPAGAELGQALASGSLDVSSSRATLLIGAYGANGDGGHVTLTAPEPELLACPEVEGIWTGIDSSGLTVEIMVEVLPPDTSSGTSLSTFEGTLRIVALDQLTVVAEGICAGGPLFPVDSGPDLIVEPWYAIEGFPWNCGDLSSETTVPGEGNRVDIRVELSGDDLVLKFDPKEALLGSCGSDVVRMSFTRVDVCE